MKVKKNKTIVSGKKDKWRRMSGGKFNEIRKKGSRTLELRDNLKCLSFNSGREQICNNQ